MMAKVGPGAVALVACLSMGSLTPAQSLSESLLAQLRAGATRLQLAGDATSVPLVGSPTLPLAPTYVNGRGPFRFLIDLGSNVVILRRDVVESAKGTVLLDRAKSDIVRLDTLQLGEARFEEVTAGAYDTLDVDGVIGYNLLQASSFTLDYPKQRLILHRSSLPEPDNATVFSYEMVDRLPYVTVRIGGGSLLVNLDTGAREYMTVPPSVQGRLPWEGGLEPGPVVTNNQTGSTKVLRGRLKIAPRLGSIALPVAEVYVNSDAETSWLGSAAMQRAAWTFDPVNHRLRVIWLPES
jgi:predicted aspartyl protease